MSISSRRWFEALARIDGPALVHCAAGKDRTGVIVALTHHLLGVPPGAMVDDYLLTNNPERFARRRPQLAAHIAEVAGRVPDEAVLHLAMGVDVSYLEQPSRRSPPAAQTVDRYLEEVLGVDEGAATPSGPACWNSPLSLATPPRRRARDLEPGRLGPGLAGAPRPRVARPATPRRASAPGSDRGN